MFLWSSDRFCPVSMYVILFSTLPRLPAWPCFLWVCGPPLPWVGTQFGKVAALAMTTVEHSSMAAYWRTSLVCIFSFFLDLKAMEEKLFSFSDVFYDSPLPSFSPEEVDQKTRPISPRYAAVRFYFCSTFLFSINFHNWRLDTTPTENYPKTCKSHPVGKPHVESLSMAAIKWVTN